MTWGGKRAGAGGVGPYHPNPRKGEANHKAKLTEEDVRLIRALYADGMVCREIAEKFEVCRQTVYKIATYENWRHVV